MDTWIALLRGINVGGNNLLPMKELRALVESLGLENVRTYIQSGNCVFDAEGMTAPSLSKQIADHIEEQFGFRSDIFAVKKHDFQQAITDNPFASYADDPKSTHVFFLQSPPTDPDLETIRALQTPSEQFALTDRAFYLYAPDGIGRSKLATKVEKLLGVSVTARNLRTVLKLSELAG